jgi:hypothetical protein
MASGAAREGEEHADASCARFRVSPRVLGLAGLAPPRLLAVRRSASPSPLRKPTVESAGRSPLSWWSFRSERSTPAPKRCSAAARRRRAAVPASPPAVPRRRPRSRGTSAIRSPSDGPDRVNSLVKDNLTGQPCGLGPGRWILIRWIRSIPIA